MKTLRVVAGASYCGGYVVDDGVALLGTSVLNIYASYFNAAVCLSPIFFSGIEGVGLRRGWVSSSNV